MKKIFLISLFPAMIMSSLMIFASSIEYNSDGSITRTDSDGKKTVINMDGKTPEGLPIPDDIKKIKNKSAEAEIIYSGAMSDMPLSFYKNDGYIKKFYNALINKTDAKLKEISLNGKKIKIVISNCRIGKTGLCGRTQRTDVKLSVYTDNTLIDEITLDHGNILGRNNYSVAAKVCVDRIFSKL